MVLGGVVAITVVRPTTSTGTSGTESRIPIESLKEELGDLRQFVNQLVNIELMLPPTNGTTTFTAGADNSNINWIGLCGYTYLCNPSFVLVGQTTRVCQSVFGTDWTGSATICQSKKLLLFKLVMKCSKFLLF